MIESDKRKGWEQLKATVYPPSIYKIYKNVKTEYFTAAVIRKGFMAAVFYVSAAAYNPRIISWALW